MLAELDDRELAANLQPTAAIIVLPGQDSFELADVVNLIAPRGAGIISDPYFDLDGLRGVVAHTSITKVLTSPKEDKKRLAPLRAVAAGAGGAGGPIEIRTSDAFHDRFFVPERGKALAFTASLNGIGKKLSLAVELPDLTAKPVRDLLTTAWKGTEPLAQAGRAPVNVATWTVIREG